MLSLYYPLKVTLGDFLRILEQPGLDPKKTAFFLSIGQGPLGFGQYGPYLKAVLKGLGYREITIFEPGCEHGYSDFGEALALSVRGAWRAIVSADILLKLLLKSRPYEVVVGSSDAAFEQSVQELCQVLELAYPGNNSQVLALQECLLRARKRFRELPVRLDTTKPLIGVVGEIFCRLNSFSNSELVRRLEEAGAEVWMNDLSEWIWYTNVEQSRALRLHGRQISLEALSAFIRNRSNAKMSMRYWQSSTRISMDMKNPSMFRRCWTTQSRICRRLAPTEKWC